MKRCLISLLSLTVASQVMGMSLEEEVVTPETRSGDWLDSGRRIASNTTTNFTRWVDGFFGDVDSDAELAAALPGIVGRSWSNLGLDQQAVDAAGTGDRYVHVRSLFVAGAADALRAIDRADDEARVRIDAALEDGAGGMVASHPINGHPQPVCIIDLRLFTVALQSP